MTHASATLRCRICDSDLRTTFVDLGASPPCEAILSEQTVEAGEAYYPLHARICDECLLVQVPEVIPAEEIFTDSYAYFSSFSTSWVEHARRYAEAMRDALGLTASSTVFEVASNDGYLLRHFKDMGIGVLGIEPTANTAAAAQAIGIPTVVEFLGEATAKAVVAEHGQADLVAANNVYAHVPDLRDFTIGLSLLLAPHGTLTIEVPHLARLIEHRQFDTIYHEHFQYYTLLTLQRALALGGLVVTDVEELASHGGSLRVFARHEEAVQEAGGAQGAAVSEAVARVLAAEAEAGLHTVQGHAGFDASVQAVKRDLMRFLLDTQEAGKTVAAYGAPGKGNTLLNYCGISRDLLPFTVDRNHHKHGHYLPGSRIPIRHPDALAEARPDYVLVMPWNLRAEISAQLHYVADWGGTLVYAIPRLEFEEPTTPEKNPEGDVR
ncbi:MAG: class I SAM-dependent methyltransferase [Dermatophilus congolensis]|nr:class I SAM-dependent methyltransferase [Dermatophilus congolensis]